MGTFDPGDLPEVGAEVLAQRVEAIELAALRATSSRAGAVDRGRRYGEDEADRRAEVGLEREQRVARAMAYAAWEYDGKPSGGTHLREFGIGTHALEGVVRGGADAKRGAK